MSEQILFPDDRGVVMRQEPGCIPAPAEAYSVGGASPNVIAERIMRIFGESDDSAFVERSDEARVLRIIQEFVRGEDVATDIDLRTLAEMFKNSETPEEPGEFADYLEYLAESVVAHSTRTCSPRFIGHMTSALPCFVRPLAKLMTALNQNQVKLETSKALSLYEREALAMMHRLVFDLPADFYARNVQHHESTLGIVTSGGTLANVTALWCARNACLGPADGFAGVEHEGLPAALEHYGYVGAVVIGSSLLHYSFEKAVGTLGVGVRGLIRVPVDENHKINLKALEAAIDRCQARKQCIIAIVGIAGTTESGAIDPLQQIAAQARRVGAQFHVDAAWGGPLLFSRRERHKLAGIEEADSVTIDGHKQMYLPMGIGMVMFRHPHASSVIEKRAHYVVRAGSPDLGKRSLEGSRPGMALFLHAALNVLGCKGYEFLIDEGIRKTRYMANAIRTRPEFELLVDPTMNILVYRFLPEQYRERAATGALTESDERMIDRLNEQIQRRQRNMGKTFVSRTTLDSTRHGTGRPMVALRAVLANPLTRESDIELVLDHQVRIANELGFIDGRNGNNE